MADVMELETFYGNLNQQVKVPYNDIGHFNILKVEELLLPTFKRVNYSRRSFYKVSMVTGHNKIHYADQTIVVNGPVLVFTNPMIPFFWERVGEGHTGFVCTFTAGFFNRFGSIKDYPVFHDAHSAVIALTLADFEQFDALFLRMFNELQSDYVYKYDLLRTLVMEVIHAALKLHPATGTRLSGASAAERISGLFVELLERQFPIDTADQTMQLRHPADFAEKLNVHINHLNKALKQISGKTTSQAIAARVLQEAKILLRSTTWSINEIAWSLAFTEPNHFTSFFKSQAGITPKEFRTTQAD